MFLAGADAELADAAALRRELPFLDFDNARFPIKGGLFQRRGGTARHDAVAWGYARGADSRGVDIIQNCEVTGFDIREGKCLGVETNRGAIKAKKVAVCVAGSSSRVMAAAGMRLPIESHVLQAFVTEGLKPVLPGVITFGAGHFYVSQSDKGGLVFGGDIDGYNTYAQRGNLPVVEDVAEGGMAIMPMIGRARLLRSWGGADGHVDGRLALHRQDPYRRALFQRRLVLWRVQGDAGERVLLRPPAGQGRAAPDRRADAPRPVPQRQHHRRKRRGQSAQPPLRSDMRDCPCPSFPPVPGLTRDLTANHEAPGSSPGREGKNETMIINHPLLGPRDAAEFVYLGDASLIDRPDWQAEGAMEQFHDYGYLRDNPAGQHQELWYHEQGDRSWLVVTRDTLTHEITRVELARDVARARGRDK